MRSGASTFDPAHAEAVRVRRIGVFRQVSLRFIDEIAAILGWSPIKRGVLRLGVRVVYLVERTWTWRRMVRLAPPVRPNALGPMPARTTANAAL